MKHHQRLLEHSLFPWPFSIAMIVITRGYINHIHRFSIEYPCINHILTRYPVGTTLIARKFVLLRKEDVRGAALQHCAGKRREPGWTTFRWRRWIRYDTTVTVGPHSYMAPKKAVLPLVVKLVQSVKPTILLHSPGDFRVPAGSLVEGGWLGRPAVHCGCPKGCPSPMQRFRSSLGWCWHGWWEADF